MNVVPWKRGSWDVLDVLRDEMEQVFHRFGGEMFPKGSGKEFATWTPKVDVEEAAKEIVVRVDLPGVDPKDVEVMVKGESLIIRGEKKEVFEEKEKNFHRVERFVGRFYREVPLPYATEVDQVQATTANGVLEVHIPKAKEFQPRKIPVTSKN